MTRKEFAEMFPLRRFSFSLNACMIRFTGGPAHGRVELHDHAHYSRIVFGEFQYEPAGWNEYRFKRKLRNTTSRPE